MSVEADSSWILCGCDIAETDQNIDCSGFVGGALKYSNAIVQKILSHPFNIELGDGTLAQNKFDYYIYQDSLYLNDFSEALILLAEKIDDNLDVKNILLSFARNAIDCEHEMHSYYLNNSDLIQQDLGKSTVCENYTNFLLSTAKNCSPAESLVALLPCFVIYGIVGLKLNSNLELGKCNPYSNWIIAYSDEEFLDSVGKMVSLANCYAADNVDQQHLLDLFNTASEYELEFWDSAYNHVV